MMISLKALIVDDERPARRWLSKLLANHPEIRIVGEADGVNSARELLPETQPDVVFLDIMMPPATGFDLLPHLAAETRIVFVTAYDSFAVKAFETNALDYLLKPVHPERLKETVIRLLLKSPSAAERPSIVSGFRDANAGSSSLGDAPLQPEDILPLRDRDILRMVAVAQIAAIQAEGAYTRIIISGQPPIMVLYSIGDWEARLPSPPFARLDRSHIINLTRVAEATMVNRNQTMVTLDEVDKAFALGRSASLRLRQLLS